MVVVVVVLVRILFCWLGLFLGSLGFVVVVVVVGGKE
jgi:hypothetical protein